MWKTILFLVFTLLVVPVATFCFDDPLTGTQSNILWLLGKIYLLTALSCFIISSVTKNYSQVDKLWSVMPIIYSWVVVCQYGEYEPRTLLMAILVSIWGVRLSYNFARRGGYSWKFWTGEEDYRWTVIQKKPEFRSPWKWILFNLLFISLYQMGLILLFTLPILKSVGGSSLSFGDIIAAVLFITLVIIETIADQQQWGYQTKKKNLINSGQKLTGSYKKGFIDTGLWSIVRHPNYTAEQAIWVVFYLFSVVATGHWINWSITGSFLLLLLFNRSAVFSEGISSEKYPEYKLYQKNTPCFVPSLVNRK